jgi:hypothetical protein
VSINIKPTTSSKTRNNLPTYGIASIQYPSGWTIDETNTQANNSSAFDIVSFCPQENAYPWW